MKLPVGVYLVGAGPGDPSLITQRALWVLQRADVVLYDYLIPQTLLSFTTKSAELICVGKRKGEHSKQQSEINELLIYYAKKGCLVVRLKGGDPTIFGRVGEEMAILESAEIDYEIIPGVSSAWAVPAYAGIPITHRQLSRSVAFVTGTVDTGQAIASHHFPEADTLVFFMAMTHIKAILKRLLSMKRFSLNTPVAVIYKGCMAAQKVCLGDLKTYLNQSLVIEKGMPALLIVGEVANKADSLNWREKLPLFGKRIIVLRQQQQAMCLYEALSLLGAEVVLSPHIQTSPLENSKQIFKSIELNRYTDIVFSSPNGVRYFCDYLMQYGGDTRKLYGKTLYSVGPKTDDTLRTYGLRSDYIAKEHGQEGILALFKENLETASVLMPGAAERRHLLSEGLSKRGAVVKELSLYKTSFDHRTPLNVEKNDGVIFSSSSTVKSFFDAITTCPQITAFCLGPVTRKKISEYFQGDIIQSDQATIVSLIDKMVQWSLKKG